MSLITTRTALRLNAPNVWVSVHCNCVWPTISKTIHKSIDNMMRWKKAVYCVLNVHCFVDLCPLMYSAADILLTWTPERRPQHYCKVIVLNQVQKRFITKQNFYYLINILQYDDLGAKAALDIWLCNMMSEIVHKLGKHFFVIKTCFIC